MKTIYLFFVLLIFSCSAVDPFYTDAEGEQNNKRSKEDLELLGADAKAEKVRLEEEQAQAKAKEKAKQDLAASGFEVDEDELDLTTLTDDDIQLLNFLKTSYNASSFSAIKEAIAAEGTLDLSLTKAKELNPDSPAKFKNITFLRNLSDVAIETIILDEQPLETLDGIEVLTTLKEIKYYMPEGQDFENLVRLKDISPIATLVNLERLQLSGMRFTDLSALANLKNLVSINFSRFDKAVGFLISDISVVAGLSKLEILNLRGVDVKDITPVSGLTSLKELELAGLGFTDLTPLSDLTELTLLNINRDTRSVSSPDGFIRDISALAGMTNMVSLYMRGLGTNDLTAVSNMMKLENVDLNFTDEDINNLTYFKDLPNLKPNSGNQYVGFNVYNGNVDPALCPTDAASQTLIDYCSSLPTE